MTELDDNHDVFVMPADWTFYQANLDFEVAQVVVAGEPYREGAIAIVTVDVTSTDCGEATLYMGPTDAAELWTALGYAIKNATGKDPVPAELIPCGDRNNADETEL